MRKFAAIDRGPNHHRERHHGRRRDHHDPDDFFGLDVREMSPRAQVVTSLAVLIPVLLGAVFVLTWVPLLWWLVFVFGWTIFPAFGLLVRGVAGLAEGDGGTLFAANDKERELLEALRDHGELTPARAAMETSLTVAEADKMLKELTEGGHLEIRVRGGALFYSLWELGIEGASRELGG